MKRFTLFVIAALFAGAAHAVPFGQIGNPKKVTCSATMSLAKSAINGKTDINILAAGHETVSLGKINPSCAKYANDNSGTCEAIISSGSLYFRYSNNSQNGNVQIEDKTTGQSTYQSWYNQFEITKSGYLAAQASLVNTSGGLGGNNRAYQVDFACQALPADWE